MQVFNFLFELKLFSFTIMDLLFEAFDFSSQFLDLF